MHLPIEHLKSGGTASRDIAVWREHGLRLVLFGDINVVAGGLPFKDGEQVVIRGMLCIINGDGTATPWSPSTSDLLAEDWLANPIEAEEDPLA